MDDRKEFSCLSGLMDIVLPAEFEHPAGEMAAKKFPYERRPQEIFMNSQGEQIITFNLLEKQLIENQVYGAVCEIERLIRHAYPESIRQRAGCTRAGDKLVGFFVFITGGLLEDQLHILFILPLLQRMMLGSYHFPQGYEGQGKETFRRIIKDIQIKKDLPESGEHRRNGDGYAGSRIQR